MKNYRIKDNLSVYKWLLDSLFKSDVKINQFSRFDDDIFTAIENKMVKN